MPSDSRGAIATARQRTQGRLRVRDSDTNGATADCRNDVKDLRQDLFYRTLGPSWYVRILRARNIYLSYY